MTRTHTFVLRVAVAALAVSFLVLACGETTGETTDGGSEAGDAAFEAAEPEAATDAATDAPRPCEPNDVGRHQPSRPPARHRDMCPDDSFTVDLVRCVLGDPTMPPEPCNNGRSSSFWAPCYACVFGDAPSTIDDAGTADANADANANADAGDSGPDAAVPIVVVNGLAQLNIGACLDLAAGRVVEGGCASSFYQEQACEQAACEQCAPEGVSRYEECVALANERSCKGILAPTCGTEASNAHCDLGSDFLTTAEAYAKRFCTAGD